MENYEQKYKEALERAKGAHNSAKSDKENGVTDKITEYTIQLTEIIFPELKESEDDNIRKSIIEVIKESSEILEKQNQKNMIAWLEQQCEQNTIVNESPSKEMILAVWELGNIWKELTKGSSCTEYGTQLQYIQKHWNESDYYEKLQGEQNK